MNIPVGDILEGELTATRPEIAISIPIALQISIYCCHKSKAPDIKLSVLVEKRLLNILLNDVTSLHTIDCLVLYESLNMI